MRTFGSHGSIICILVAIDFMYFPLLSRLGKRSGGLIICLRRYKELEKKGHRSNKYGMETGYETKTIIQGQRLQGLFLIFAH